MNNSTPREPIEEPRFHRSDGTEQGNPAVPLPTAHQLLSTELTRIERRLQLTASGGRAQFFDGSDSYDHAVVAIIRLAALFENERSRFGALLDTVTDTERRAIIATRNITAHHGYAVMDDDVFWATICEDVPALIAKIRRQL